MPGNDYHFITRWRFEATAHEVNDVLDDAADLVRWWPDVYLAVEQLVDVTYDWKVRADKPLLRYLSFLLKPIFSANHHWAMARGEERLRQELARRREKVSGRKGERAHEHLVERNERPPLLQSKAF